MSAVRVAVVGLGMIGGSVARRLAPDHDVRVWDTDPGTRQAAERAGLRVADDLTEPDPQAGHGGQGPFMAALTEADDLELVFHAHVMPGVARFDLLGGVLVAAPTGD